MASSPISPDALAAAAERRVSQLPTQPSAAQLSAAHERRQAFRRLIDPGILRPNSKEQAMASLKVQCSLCYFSYSLNYGSSDLIGNIRELAA
jgi:hypothetical protein